MNEAPTPPHIPVWRGEAARWLLLLAAGLWFLHPFLTARQMGAGDALWYANMLADFVTQWRAGVFPVFAGQTEYAFNGAVYPLRVAPLYQHLAGIIDLLTGRHLGFYALQHATVLVCGFAGLLAAYLAGVRLAPQQRWPACGFAVLYLGCPGVLGAIYTQDLYMTWMTVPFLPLAVYGILRSFTHDDMRSQVWLSAPLAALWFAHSPIALWMTLIVAASQIARLTSRHRSWAAVKRAGWGAAIFITLGHYPFISVASLDTAGSVSAVSAGLTEQERITNVIREVFPAVLQPVSEAAGALSDLQLGYSLWVVLVFVVITVLRPKPPPASPILAIACTGLLMLLLPVPWVTDWLWEHLPEQIKRITYYWPMHRFYLLLAALLSQGGTGALACWLARSQRSRAVASAMLVVACGWSVWEARQFVRAGRLRTASAETSARSQRPENLLLMSHAYGIFPSLPAYFSHGVMDPRAEARLLSAADGEPQQADPRQLSPDAWLHGVIDANPGVLELSPALRLDPGQRYALDLDFPAGREPAGVLQLAGRTFFREYLLPESGQPRAFGSRPGNSPTLPLWTTGDAPEEITLRFIPTAPGARPADFAKFARYRLREIEPGAAVIEVTSLLPFRTTVRAPEAGALLETPRMFLPGYTADVGGRSVEVGRSAQGLATVAVPRGLSEVTLSYRAPLSVRLSYWAVLTAWLGLVTIGTIVHFRQSTRPSGGTTTL